MLSRVNLLSIALTFLTLLCPIGVSAQQSETSALIVEPANLNFELTAEANESSSIVVITNQYDYEVNLRAEFKAIDEANGRIIPAGELDSVINDVLELSESEFTIAPQSRYFLTVTVTDSAILPAGGHYATLVLKDVSLSDQTNSISSQVAIGTFIVKQQGEVKNLLLSKRIFERRFFEFPTHVEFEFFNDGNVHLTPRGYLRIFDSDEVFYETILNSNSSVILPSQRLLEERDIVIAAGGWLPKKVTIELGYRADGIDDMEIFTENFWYIPLYVIPVPIGVTALGILIYVAVLRKRIRSRN